ncbi:hypothetical protein [Marinifilum caeruleilacunae]|uniref:DUF7663 domain-containing protein n=1 Tax=Marinifilum caeruleilacunae TaxID=2499076 RepID=A0ABX1WWT2_9BACT|nr:hypothetical protein [Marinifilum caeruleilacunae]NOU60585.1 hypothetical protein [Marinifilum caeruleilacunae]
MILKELLLPISDSSGFNAFFENLAEHPKTFWYVSAGTDFRGPVYLTDFHINHQLKYHREKLEKPELYLFNCLGSEVKQLERKLKRKNKTEFILFEDEFTRIKAIDYIPVKIDRERLNYSISDEFIVSDHVQDPLTYQENDAFLLNIEIESLSENFKETTKIIYLQMENINCLQNVILNEKAVDVQYLCATREGNGFGNCKRSIIKEIYEHEDHYQSQGFDPDYVITFTDFTEPLFLEKMASKNRKLKKCASLPFEYKEQMTNNNSVYQIIK